MLLANILLRFAVQCRKTLMAWWKRNCRCGGARNPVRAAPCRSSGWNTSPGLRGRRRGGLARSRRHASRSAAASTSGVRSVGMREIDLPVDPGAARHADVGALLAEGPRVDRLSPARSRARAEPRRRPHLSELQSHRRHDGVRERRVSADAARGRRRTPSRVDAALARVGLTARAKQRPGSLSGGHQQLVAVARASPGGRRSCWPTSRPATWIRKSGEALMQMFGSFTRAGSTVCLATHDPRYIAMAPRHLYLFDGRLVDRPEA